MSTAALALATLALAGGSFKREGIVFRDAGWNNPDIVRTGDGRYRAYFMDTGRILSAISTDGRRFSLEEGERIQGEHPALLKLTDGRVRLYFSRHDAPGLRSAVSEDGLEFTEEPGIRLQPGASGAPDSRGMIHPSAVKLPDGRVRVYYDAVGEPEGQFDLGWNGVKSATSRDGLKFKRDKGMRLVADDLPAAGMVWSPFVRREGRRWALYVSTESHRKPRRNNGIWRAESSREGLRFSVKDDKPFFGVDPATPDIRPGPGGSRNTPQDAFLLKVKGGERLFYWEVNEGTLSAFRRG